MVSSDMRCGEEVVPDTGSLFSLSEGDLFMSSLHFELFVPWRTESPTDIGDRAPKPVTNGFSATCLAKKRKKKGKEEEEKKEKEKKRKKRGKREKERKQRAL